MKEVNQKPLTIKYRTRLAAAMIIETEGYFVTRVLLRESLKRLNVEDLIELKKAYMGFKDLHMRGAAKYVDELITRMKAA